MERVGGKFCSCETWLTPEAGLRPLPPQTCRPEAIASTDTFPRTRCHVGLEDGLYVGVKQSHISVPPSPHRGPRSGDFSSPRLCFLLANQRNPPTQVADLGSNEMFWEHVGCSRPLCESICILDPGPGQVVGSVG